ncbi:MAG: hypothetical protein B5M55_01160 [Desulfococcus sp. 4484_242]|nr:MAG: hypothetical protein B5M55_01160 [Desulfococcus sp. 4484_242]
METERIRIKTLILCLGAVIAVEPAARLGIGKDPVYSIVILGAVRLIQTGIMVVIVSAGGKSLLFIGLSLQGMIPGIKRGLIWSAGFGLVALLAGGLAYLMGMDALSMVRTPLPDATGAVILFFIVGGVIAPVTEEVLFRGVLYGFFRRWGAVPAILLSAFAFVLAHPVSPAIPITQIVGGLVFGLAYEVEKNLMVPIAIHALGNMTIFGLSLIS